MAVDTLGNPLPLHVTPACTEDRDEGETPVRTVQAIAGDSGRDRLG
jgi:hypothetical protein